MDVGIDKTRARRHPLGIDDELALLEVGLVDGPHLREPLAINQDRVPGNERIAPLAGHDSADIDNRRLHEGLAAILLSSICFATRSCARPRLSPAAPRSPEIRSGGPDRRGD